MTDQALMECIVSFRSKPGNKSSFGTYLGLEILDVDKGKALVRGLTPENWAATLSFAAMSLATLSLATS